MNFPVSILVLTKNEEQDLPGCLESVSWSNDVHVFDSLSTDATVAIAEQFGARVTTRRFDDWATHQNWGLNNIPFKNPWVFYIDADERMTPELVQSVQRSVENGGLNVAFRVQRRDFFMNRWLKHVQTSSYYIRLFQPQKIRYERLVNPVSIADGPVGEVSGYLDHFPFSKGVTHWIDRHNSYSALEAKQILENRKERTKFSIKKALFAKDFNERRFHQKELFYRLPGRPLIKFLILYFGKQGYLDGRPGLTYATLQSIYEYFIVLKLKELKEGMDKDGLA